MSWPRDSTRTLLRQLYCAVLTAQLHVKLIPLLLETRYAVPHVNCIILARVLARPPQAKHPAIGDVARGLRQRSQGEPVAGDRLCRRPCGAVDLHPDQPQGGPGRPHGCRGSLRLGTEVPAWLWKASAAGGMGCPALVQGFSSRRLGDLRAGNGDGWMWPRDLLADQPARGRSSPRLLCRGNARAVSDLQFQRFQVQPRSAAAGDAAARGAGLFERV